MKKLALLLSIVWLQGIVHAQDSLRVMSFNIRYNNPDDGINAWPNRKEMVAQQIIDHQVDLLGVQEALHDQIEDLNRLLPGFAQVGVGRDDGKHAGEYAAIYYNKARFKLIKSGNFWLSQTPEVPGSIGWDADQTRIVTWALFKDLRTGKRFWHFNTHYDHRGKEARKQSSKLLLNRMAALAKKDPVVVTGDFNASPVEEPIQILLDSQNRYHLTNTASVSHTPPIGENVGLNGFKGVSRARYPIDFVFVKGKWTVLYHHTISEPKDGRYSSDHLPVLATLIR
jgi:endonuclease/exonuclease/phosphatase family metal-dependent hydrolase